MMLIYKSVVGTFWIKRYANGACILGINNEALGQYSSAFQAADDVYLHVTGYYPWDSLDGKIENVPSAVYEWEQYS